MRRIRHKPFRYPGILGKRPTHKELIAASDAALLHVPPDDSTANRIAAKEYERERIAKLLNALLEHFAIALDADPVDRYFSLAYRLACRHVPAFQDPVRAGRKPKSSGSSLQDIFDSLPTQKKRTGAPTKWTDEMRLVWVNDIRNKCAELGLDPDRRGSIKEAIEQLFSRAPQRVRSKWPKRLQKLYSESRAKGLVPKRRR